MQGLSAGAGQIISRAMVRDIYVGDRAQQVMSQIAMIFGLAPALAPIVGGWLLVHGNWRGIFWFLAVLGAALLVMVWVFLPETHPPHHRTPLRGQVRCSRRCGRCGAIRTAAVSPSPPW